MGKEEERHLAEELAVAGEYALDQRESKSLVEVLESVGVADGFRYPTDRAPKMAVTR